MFALAIALMATAMVGRSVMLLRLSRADLERARAEHALEGAHLLAAATVVRAGEGGPYRWALATDLGFAEALAESEGDKLALADSGQLTDETFAAMGVAQPAVIRTRLAASPQGVFADVGALDGAPLWRECAASLVSSLGQAAQAPTTLPAEPRPRPETPDWRVGEAWRIRITTAAGWRDDRIVRFTGDARHPVAVVWRKLSRSDGGQGQCDAVLAAAA